MKPTPLYLYAFLVALAVAHSMFYYPAMPEVMATHFASGGRADGWMHRETFFAGAAGMLLLNLVIFVISPWLMERFRFKNINIPNRSYWLAPGRIDELYAYLREKMAWFGIANTVFGTGVVHLVFLANLADEKRLNNTVFIGLLIGYFAFVIIWLVTLFRKFYRTV